MLIHISLYCIPPLIASLPHKCFWQNWASNEVLFSLNRSFPTLLFFFFYSSWKTPLPFITVFLISIFFSKFRSLDSRIPLWCWIVSLRALTEAIFPQFLCPSVPRGQTLVLRGNHSCPQGRGKGLLWTVHGRCWVPDLPLYCFTEKMFKSSCLATLY